MENCDKISNLKIIIENELNRNKIVIIPPQDVKDTLQLMSLLEYKFDTVMIDPWYNKGYGGVREDYVSFFLDVIYESGKLGDHIFFWGFPEIVAPFVEKIPSPLKLTCWLTWYYKNSPSVVRGWRGSQNSCLHLSKNGSRMFPERFLNDKQLELKKRGKLRYMPGPTSVIEESLLVGFVGKKEKVGHPSQKPCRLYEKLLKMTVSDGGLVLDPMSGSGTTGFVSKELGFKSILCDCSEEYTVMMENRLQTKRLDIYCLIKEILHPIVGG